MLLARERRRIEEWSTPLARMLILLPLAVGCASPGVPKPPSLKLPEPTKNLVATRVGDLVTLDWTNPTETTDHLKIKGTVTAVICREQPSRKRGPGACTPVDRKAVLPGAAEQALEPLPPDLTTSASRALSYRVELQNEHGRSAGRSEPARTASGAAPAPVEHLDVTSRRDGALVRWNASGDGWVEIKRVRLDPPARSSSGPLAAPASKSVSKPNSKPAEPAVVLRGGEGDKITDKGGMLDTGVERAAHYRYTAQRVRQITVGGHPVTLRGPESAPINFSLRDTFAPATPAGLVAVPGSGSIDLSWQAGEEPNLAGYNVYRTGRDGVESRLTPDPAPGPAFRDQTTADGTTYTYRVTAVDANGNESKRSAAVTETGR